MAANLTLKMLLGDQIIGDLSFDKDSEHFSVTYTKEWQLTGFAISPMIPLDGSGTSTQISMFLTNLLPENKGLDYLIESLGVSKNNTFALIKSIGLDTAGAISFVASNEVRKTELRLIAEAEIVQRIEDPELHPIEVWDGKPRLSVAGVQPKLNVFFDGKQLGLGEGSLCSTHILKFEKHKHIIINEWLTMRLAKAIDMNVAPVEIMQFGLHRALLVTRFDRFYNKDKNAVLRRHIIDSCQALGFSVNKKYERNFGNGRDVKHIRDGVSFAKLTELTKQCINPISAKLDLMKWAFFNLITGNSDAHGKNYSYYLSASGIEPTPWYDLVNVSLYEEFEQELAMAVDDTFDANQIEPYELASFVDSLDLPQALASSTLSKMCTDIQAHFKTVVGDLPKYLNVEEEHFIEKYQEELFKQSARYLKIAKKMDL